jgi:hypothetical protein
MISFVALLDENTAKPVISFISQLYKKKNKANLRIFTQ